MMRRTASIYFLIIAVPCGLWALFGDFMFSNALLEEVQNWHRRSPHGFWWYENTGFILFYLVIINAGFLLLFGYGAYLRFPPYPTKRFWILSAIYNLSIGVTNDFYVPRFSLMHPSGIPFWMVVIPCIGLVVSIICLKEEAAASLIKFQPRRGDSVSGI